MPLAPRSASFVPLDHAPLEIHYVFVNTELFLPRHLSHLLPKDILQWPYLVQDAGVAPVEG